MCCMQSSLNFKSSDWKRRIKVCERSGAKQIFYTVVTGETFVERLTVNSVMLNMPVKVLGLLLAYLELLL